MCKDCCARQDHGFVMCKCSIGVAQEIRAARKEGVKDNLCKNCSSQRDETCKNNLCAACCLVQAFRLDCPFHDESFYCKEARAM